MDEPKTAEASEAHTHKWVKTDTLVLSGGVPYEVEQVKCRECGAIREQDKKRIVA